MNINRQNYESILIDYLDGLLSQKEEAELMLFLIKNPDIAEELDGMQEVSITPDKTFFPQKKQLKKSNGEHLGINDYNDYLCITELEGDISKDEKTQLSKLLENDNFRKTQTFFSNTKLRIPYEIVYPNKSNLKRLRFIPVRHSVFKTGISIAATIATMLVLYNTVDLYNPQQVATELNKVNITQKTKEERVSENSTPEINTSEKQETIQVEKKTEYQKIKQEEIISKNTQSFEKEPEVRPLSSLPAKLNQIAAVHPVRIKLPQTTSTSTQERITENQIQNNGSTKEYSLSDIARIGLKRVANSLGVEYNVQKDEKGNVEKISVESSILAFSTTRNNKNE
ncbi:MAG: hypothetical protein AB7S48_10555 [Bacteroidales bacterium]